MYESSKYMKFYKLLKTDVANAAQTYFESQFVGNKSRGICQKLQSISQFHGNTEQAWFNELMVRMQENNMKCEGQLT